MTLFRKDNLLAWCIVLFDVTQRDSKQRVAMLQRLGIGALAYDWRDEHLPLFDEELRQLRDHEIELSAFWLAGSAPKDADAARADRHIRAVLDFVERNGLQIEVWKTCGGPHIEELADLEERLDTAVAEVSVLADLFADLGCTYGLYNHGGWGGLPQTMIDIAKRTEETGIVYNFHHGHEHLAQMPADFNAMVPHLLCVNLNGMAVDGEKILPLGDGDNDLALLNLVVDSDYSGPVGLLDHRPEMDAEESLRQNLDGLQRLLAERGDQTALATYI